MSVVPLLSLAQPAVDLGAGLRLGEPGEVRDIGGVWNAITKAADLVKDGERLENLAWRHWARPRTPPAIPQHKRRTSSSSMATASTVSIHTPVSETAPSLPPVERPKTTFGKALTLLLEDDNSFKDWITEAQRNATIPSLSVPDTPIANVEIRLVEPTPVPSRVGSLGGSMAASNLLGVGGKINSWNNYNEERPPEPPLAATAEKTKGRFFLPSSPSKDSSEDDSRDDSSRTEDESAKAEPTKPAPSRRKAASMTSVVKAKHKAAKRETQKSPAKDESSGWEDEDEDDGEWSDEPDEPPPKPNVKKSKKELEEEDAQKKREMFAKQQIFGSGTHQGLLSGIFRTGGSMVDLTKAPNAKPSIRPCPTHGNLSSFADGESPTHAPNLIRSKSAVAMPLQTGVSVTSKSGIADAESFDEGTDDDYLATSSTQKKLAELASKREQREKAQPVPQSSGSTVRLDEHGVVLPVSPTTRRREIIMREMSESLRRNLILERQKSSTVATSSSRVSTSPRRNNVLTGGFLRPLTRVPPGEVGAVNRTKSTANLSGMAPASPTSPGYAAPAMVRRSTEGVTSVEERRARASGRRHGSHDVTAMGGTGAAQKQQHRIRFEH